MELYLSCPSDAGHAQCSRMPWTQIFTGALSTSIASRLWLRITARPAPAACVCHEIVQRQPDLHVTHERGVGMMELFLVHDVGTPPAPISPGWAILFRLQCPTSFHCEELRLPHGHISDRRFLNAVPVLQMPDTLIASKMPWTLLVKGSVNQRRSTAVAEHHAQPSYSDVSSECAGSARSAHAGWRPVQDDCVVIFSLVLQPDAAAAQGHRSLRPSSLPCSVVSLALQPGSATRFCSIG